MATAKKSLGDYVLSFLTFLFIFLLPFGQLFRVEIPKFLYPAVIYPHEIVMFICVSTLLIRKPKIDSLFKDMMGIMFIFSFSYLLSLFLYPQNGYAGGFYLIRLFLYTGFAWFVKNQIKSIGLTDVLNLLNISLTLILLLGVLQYFFFPDLRSLKILGWDDHLFRLVGTYLDPGYTGLVLVFGFNLCFYLYLAKKSKIFGLQALLFVFGLLLTYSRASYLAFAASLIMFSLYQRELVKKVVVFFGIFLTCILFLPRSASEGVQLERTNSIDLRVKDYLQTLKIATKSPVFGVGFNNICYFKPQVYGRDKVLSHSCFGADSSFFLMLATTGIVGLIIFIDRVLNIGNLVIGKYKLLMFPIAASLFVHSMFLNSIFYTFVLGYLVIFLGVTTKVHGE